MTYDVIWLFLAALCVLGLLALSLAVVIGTSPASDKLADEAERWEK